MTLDDPTEPLRFRVGVAVIALTLAPVVGTVIRLAEGHLRAAATGLVTLVAGMVLSGCGIAFAGRGMPGRVGPRGWRRVGVGALLAAPGIALLLFTQKTMEG